MWFTDPRLAGNPATPFGVNGIRIDKSNKMVYVSVTLDAGFDGKIYRLPLVDSPDPDDLEADGLTCGSPQGDACLACL